MIMLKHITISTGVALSIMSQAFVCCGGENYQNFDVAVYARAYEVREMGEMNWLEPRWNEIARQVRVDKVYLETHRDTIIVDEETITKPRNSSKAKVLGQQGVLPLPLMRETSSKLFAIPTPNIERKLRKLLSTRRGFSMKLFLMIFSLPTVSANRALKPKATKAGHSSGWT
jgi:hypothetical protein